MRRLSGGLHHLKSSIRIHAPVEICYQTWLDAPCLPAFMSRVIAVRPMPKDFVTSDLLEELQPEAQLLQQGIIPMSTIKQWLLSGPGGKIYHVENIIILEIPNRFYCTTSIDPDDLSIQNSLTFMPDQMNRNTTIEWEVSFWVSIIGGQMTRLASDILETGDSFLEYNLQDFKTHLEST